MFTLTFKTFLTFPYDPLISGTGPLVRYRTDDPVSRGGGNHNGTAEKPTYITKDINYQ